MSHLGDKVGATGSLLESLSEDGSVDCCVLDRHVGVSLGLLIFLVLFVGIYFQRAEVGRVWPTRTPTRADHSFDEWLLVRCSHH